MKEIAKFLFKIDKLVFDQKEVQFGLFGFFVALLFGHLVGIMETSRVTTWVEIGLVVYIGLFIYRFASNKNEFEELKKTYQSKGIFPFVKGLTYALLLGPIGLLLAVFLAMLPKSEKTKSEDPDEE